MYELSLQTGIVAAAVTQKLYEVTALGRIPLGRSKERSLCFPAPVDDVIWIEKTEALFDRLSRTLHLKQDHVRVDLWVTGTVSPRERQELLHRGIVAREILAQEIQALRRVNRGGSDAV